MNKAPLLTPRLEQAMNMAIRVHGNMKRKGNGQPYLVHPMSVLALLVRWEADEDTCIAGLLHDVIEDADDDTKRAEYRKEIEDIFGKGVLEIVEGVTEQDKSLSWKERKKLYLEHLQNASKESLLVSCADQTHNTACLVEGYARDGEEFWKRFNAIKQWKVWYIDQVKDILKQRLDEKYFSEFLSHLKALNELLSKPIPTEYQSWGIEKSDANKMQIIMDPLFLELWDHCMLTEEEMESGILDMSKKEKGDDAVPVKSPDAVDLYLMGIQHFRANDFENALKFITQAAEMQLPTAQFSLGACYYLGKGVPCSEQTALEWFLRGAANGQPHAQKMLSEWYEMGIVVKEDMELSKTWREIANQHGQFSPLKNGDLEPREPTQAEILVYRFCQSGYK